MTDLEGNRQGNPAVPDGLGNESSGAHDNRKSRRVDSVEGIAGFVASATVTATAIPANPFAVSSTGGSAAIMHSMPTSTCMHHVHNAPLMLQAESMCTEEDEITVDTGTESQPVTIDVGRNGTGVHVEVAGGVNKCNISIQKGVMESPVFPSVFPPQLHPPGREGKIMADKGSEAALLDSDASLRWGINASESSAGSSERRNSATSATPVASSHGVALQSSSSAVSASKPLGKNHHHHQQQSQPHLRLPQQQHQQSMNMGRQASCGSEDGESAATRPGSTRKRRLVRLDDGSLVVLPTNIYRQAGGLKLDLSLGGIRINGERCTMKNRAFNFGVLHGFSKENILALRAFRDIIVPSDRSTATSIHVLAAAEALRRYDEEHLPPPAGSETASYEGVGGWIPDSQEVQITVVGSKTEMRVRASELRAVDRPLECRKVLEALKANPEVLAGHVELAPEVSVAQDEEDGGAGGVSVGLSIVGEKAGSLGTVVGTGLTCLSVPRSSTSSEGSGRAADMANLLPSTFSDTVRSAVELPEQLTQQQQQQRQQRQQLQQLPESPATTNGNAESCAPRRRRRKKKAVLTEDGEVYDLPTYVQNVETKQNRSTLRLKMPLSGFLVNGEESSVADLVVACGLEVTRKNLLALRGARDAVLQHFAGPPAVQRLVAAEVFHVWAKRRLSSAVSSAPWATPTSAIAASSELKSFGEAMAATSGIGTSATAALVSSMAALTGGGGGEAHAAAVSMSTPSMLPLLLCEGPALMDEAKSLEMPLVATSETSTGAVAASQGVATGVTVGTTHASTDAASTFAASTTQGGVASILSPSAMSVGEETCPSELGVAEQNVGAAHYPETALGTALLSPSTVGTAGLSRPSAAPPSSVPLEFPDDSVVTVTGPPSISGAVRPEVRMTVSELREARAQRTAVFRQLVNTMLNDPVVQGGELDTATQQSMMMMMMTTPYSCSPSAAPFPKNSVQDSHLGGTSHPLPLTTAMSNTEGGALSGCYSGVVTVAHPSANGSALVNGSVCLPTSSPVSPPSFTSASAATPGSIPSMKLDLESQQNECKRLAGVGTGDTDSGIATSHEKLDGNAGGPQATEVGQVGWDGRVGAGISPENDDDWVRPSMTPEVAAASKRRRQLWMQEISANERRYVRRKEQARREFETRQQQLLKWMVDEEAGQHDDLDGDAGPPPDESLAELVDANGVGCNSGT